MLIKKININNYIPTSNFNTFKLYLSCKLEVNSYSTDTNNARTAH